MGDRLTVVASSATHRRGGDIDVKCENVLHIRFDESEE